MGTSKNDIYFVTAISRLTGEREVVSTKCSFDGASSIRERMLKTKPHKRSYIYHRIQTDFVKSSFINFI